MGSASGIAISRLLWLTGFFVFVLHGANTVFDVGAGRWEWVTTQWTPVIVFAICTATSIIRGLSYRRERAAWFALAVGLAFYALGAAVLAVVTLPSGFPAVPDLLAWMLYPAALLALWRLAGVQRRWPRADLRLDGVIGGLAVASVGVVIVFDVVIDPLAPLAGSPGNLVFVMGDLLAIGFGIGACALLGWRPSGALVTLILGFVALAIDDTLFMSAVVKGTFVPAGPLDSYWLLAVLLITAAAAWAPPVPRLDKSVKPTSVIAFPVMFALMTVVFAGYAALMRTHNVLAIVLTTLTLFAVVARFALTIRAHLAMIELSEHDAVTDPLTGLGNRRKLRRDAEALFAEATLEHPVLFAIFDLDGLKPYNDTYGHPAGDALLVRLGAKLSSAMGPTGCAYRIGGDEFCLLLTGGSQQRDRALTAAAAALTDRSESSTIGNCYGSVLVPSEATDVAEAMQHADRRLYTAKFKRPNAAGREARETLRRILIDSDPGFDDSHDVVGRLVHAVAGRLGIDGEQLAAVTHAAALRDIGRIAIPDAILHKPGPLTDEEWQSMRRHAAVGESVLLSIPALKAAAHIVRASHERYDGGGYPDGLGGQQIPLGARIIFACNAYHAMITDRPHRAAMSHADALAELHRHSGTQFDPVVIETLASVLSTSDPQARAPGSTSAPTNPAPGES